MVEKKIYYETLDTSSISPQTLNRIFELEQDMWARGVGEYIKCTACGKVFSKAEIYDATEQQALINSTVQEIERILFNGDTPDCRECHAATQHIYSYDTYFDEISHRYSRDQSFLSVARDQTGKIVGFMDAYIDTLEKIFSEEFASHFSPDLLKIIMQEFALNQKQMMLTFSSLGMHASYKSLTAVFGLIREFFGEIESSCEKYPAIFESIIGSTTYAIFSIMGAQRLHISRDKNLVLNGQRNTDFHTDILFQRNIVHEYKNNFHMRSRDVMMFLKYEALRKRYIAA